MKITVKAKALTTGLSFVGRAAAKQGSSSPHLSSVLFEAEKESGLTTMRTTDAEVAASLTSTAPKVLESGKAAVSIRTLSDLMGRVQPEKEVVIEATDSEATLTVEGTENHYSLRTQKADEFPPLPTFPSEADESFSLGARTLREAIRRVSPAASKDEQRPVLTGLLFSFEAEGKAKGKAESGTGGRTGTEDGTANEDASDEGTTGHSTVLNVVATDSYRMMVFSEKSGKIDHPPGRAIIPVRALKEVSKLCSMGPEYIDVALTDNSAFFRVGGVMLTTRLIAGNFPEYRRLLPEGETFEHTFRVDTSGLLDVLYRVNLFAAARQTPAVPVRLSFSPTQDLLEVFVQSEAVGSATESLPAKALTSGETNGGGQQEEGNDQNEGKDENFEIHFNPAYLTDAVKSCADAGEGGAASSSVVLCMKAAHKPAVLKPAYKEDHKEDYEEDGDAAGNSGATLECLVMPMNDPRPKEEASS